LVIGFEGLKIGNSFLSRRSKKKASLEKEAGMHMRK